MSGRYMWQVVAAAAVATGATSAQAGGFAFGFGYGRFGPPVFVGGPVVAPAPVIVRPAPVVVRPAPVIVRAAPVVVVRPPVVVPRIWVAPVYRTVVERVWVPTVRSAYREVPVLDECGVVVSYRRERYIVNSGHWTEVSKRVLVRDGYWSNGPAREVTRIPPPADVGAVPAEPEPDAVPAAPDEEYGNVQYDDGELPAPNTLRSSDRIFSNSLRASAIR